MSYVTRIRAGHPRMRGGSEPRDCWRVLDRQLCVDVFFEGRQWWVTPVRDCSLDSAPPLGIAAMHHSLATRNDAMVEAGRMLVLAVHQNER